MANTPEITRLHFQEGTAPFGELHLVRADHGYDVGEPTFEYIDGMAPEMLEEAWLNSQWLREAVGEEKMQEMQTAFLKHPPFVGAVQKACTTARYCPNKQHAWYAIEPTSREEHRKFSHGVGLPVMARRVVGLALANNDVSGNRLQRGVKRLFVPAKVYAKISDVAVDVTKQGENIAVALSYAALLNFKEKQKLATYVMSTHTSMREWLVAFDFKETGSRVRTNLVEGAELKEIRLQADSVGAVRERLVITFPWLTSAIDLSYTANNPEL